MGALLKFQVELEAVTCISCGVEFTLPTGLKQQKLRDHSVFYCPNGHQQIFSGKSEEEKLREQLRLSELRELDLRRNVENARLERDKLQRRIQRGVCPCCKRSFTALRRHMKSKHPDYPAVEMKP